MRYLTNENMLNLLENVYVCHWKLTFLLIREWTSQNIPFLFFLFYESKLSILKSQLRIYLCTIVSLSIANRGRLWIDLFCNWQSKTSYFHPLPSHHHHHHHSLLGVHLNHFFGIFLNPSDIIFMNEVFWGPKNF